MVRETGWEFGVGDWTEPRLRVVHYAAFEAWYICVHLDQIQNYDFVFKHHENVHVFLQIIGLPCMKKVGLVSIGRG